MVSVKNILVGILVLGALAIKPHSVNAQQDPIYTQYVDNLLMVNPAYAGSKENGEMLFVSRNQWVSIEGAPTTHSFSYNTPLEKKNIGLGFSVLHDKIGPQTQTGVYFDYAYSLDVSRKYKLGMGLKLGVSFYRAALSDLVTITPDPIFEKDVYKNYLPNVGVGFFMHSDDTYFGLSVPKLIENTITREDYETEYVSREEIHLYLLGGKNFELGDELQLKTSAMFQFVQNTPITIQASVLMGLRERFWIGLMGRSGDAFGIVTQLMASDKLMIGYSFDLTISELNSFSNGTHELMIRYNLNLFN